MKKVLLLGDSIRVGYQQKVKEKLQGEAEVYFDEMDNGRFASYTLWQANQLFRQWGKMDVVHWNNGYWDMNVEEPANEPVHPVDEYQHFLRRIIKLCRQNSKEIIFATTTPVLKSGAAKDNTGTQMVISYDNEWVKKYNNAAKEVMAEENVTVNDLYQLMLEDDNYYKCPDLLHLSEEGNEVASDQICKYIREKLK